MGNFKKIIAVVLSATLVVTAAIAGTLAYQSSSAGALNTMTLGQVEIKQIEQERVNDTDKQDELTAFTQKKPLLPAVYPGDSIAWAPQDEWVVPGDQAWKVVADNENVIDKFVTVSNTGDHDAYVRTVIAYEGSVINGKDIHIVANTDNVDPQISVEYVENVMIDGVRYDLAVYTYPEVLASGETTIPSLKQVYMDKSCDNSDVAAYGDTYDILVVSQAVQAKGFSNAKTALDDAFGEISATNHPWIATEPPVMNNNVLDLSENLYLVGKPFYHNYTATEPYTINGNGNTVMMANADVDSFDWTENGTISLMSNVFSSEDGALVTVNDLTITGTMHSVTAGNYEKTNQGRHNTVFNNVSIINAEVLSYSDPGVAPALTVYGKMEMNNCRVYGTTLSPMDTDYYTVYDMIVVNLSDTTINGGKIGTIFTWAKVALEINDAEVDEITSACRVTTDCPNGGLVIGDNSTVGKITVINNNAVVNIKSGAVVDTLDLSNITNKTTINITIEPGATVNNIISNGTTYESVEAWKNA